MFLPNTKVEIETYITANLIVDSETQKEVANRKTRFHDLMTRVFRFDLWLFYIPIWFNFDFY